jgi:hypothetical protein
VDHAVTLRKTCWYSPHSLRAMGVSYGISVKVEDWGGGHASLGFLVWRAGEAMGIVGYRCGTHSLPGHSSRPWPLRSLFLDAQPSPKGPL